MKNKKYFIIISTAFLAPLIYADYYSVIVKYKKYEIKDATLIPQTKTPINVTSLNGSTNISSSENIKVKPTYLNSESGDIIQIITDVKDVEKDGKVLTGSWSANKNLEFYENNKNEALFITPEYDGVYYLNLQLKDGSYIKNYRALELNIEHWSEIDPIYGDWQIDKVIEDWNPNLNTAYENTIVDQNRIVDRSRTRQDREIRESINFIRLNGDVKNEIENNYTENRSDYGTIEYWTETDPLVVNDWVVKEVLQDWTPSNINVYETEMVNQFREIKKERTIKDQEYRPKTDEIRTVGSNHTDTSLLEEYREVQGQLEYWENTGDPLCTEWELDNYTPWLPNASEYDKSETVDQSRTKSVKRECTGQQYRPFTDQYRDAVAEIEYNSDLERRTVQGAKINLNDWAVKDTNGIWSVSNDGSYAYQGKNGDATIFESISSDYGNTVIKGKMRVSVKEDDDFIGIVVGKTDNNNFLLWSWKKAQQAINGGTSKEGHALAKVTGGVKAVNWFMDINKTGYQVLDTNLSTTNGWNYNQYYNFEITYTDTNISIVLDGNEILSANGNFDTGKIGFFNLSQNGVEYYKVSDNKI